MICVYEKEVSLLNESLKKSKTDSRSANEKLQVDLAAQQRKHKELLELLEERELENEKLSGIITERDALVKELLAEKQDRTKTHLTELENLKLSHEQELYMLKKLSR